MCTIALPLAFSAPALWKLVGTLHPVLVHFPVALLVVAGLLEAWAWRRGREPSAEGILLVRLGAIAAVAAAVSGWSFAEANEPTRALFLHRWGGIAVAALSLVAAALVRGDVARAGYRPLAILLLPLVGAVGHFGGEMTWGEGYVLRAVKAVFAEPREPDAPAEGPPAEAASAEERAFLVEVWPILRENCLGCHGPRKQKGDLRFDDRAIALGEPGIIVPGDPGASRLVEVLRLPAEDDERMPPPKEGPPLPEGSIAAIERWIAAGAAWPEVVLPPATGGSAETGLLPATRPPFPGFGAVAHAQTGEGDEPSGEEIFRTVVYPTFADRCTGCHGEKKRKSGLRLDRPGDLFDETREERIVVPGDPGASALLRRVSRPAGHDERMPPDGPTVSEEQIAGIRAWIAAGAPWPADVGSPETPPAPPPEPPAPVSIELRELAEVLMRAAVDPALAARCERCHGAETQKGGFRVDDAASLRARLEPGVPAKSEILRRVMLPASHEDHMPKEGPALTPVEGEALRAWIAAGAPVPERRNLVAPPAGAGTDGDGKGADRSDDGDGDDDGGGGRGRGRGRGGRRED